MELSSRYAGTILSSAQVELIKEMYPYGALDYTSLNRVIGAYLQEKYGITDAKKNERVLALSQHNGAGWQWGVVLIYDDARRNWILASHFGHTDDRPLTREQIIQEHVHPVQYRLWSAAIPDIRLGWIISLVLAFLFTFTMWQISGLAPHWVPDGPTLLFVAVLDSLIVFWTHHLFKIRRFADKKHQANLKELRRREAQVDLAL
jgi:hypothetical protein